MRQAGDISFEVIAETKEDSAFLNFFLKKFLRDFQLDVVNEDKEPIVEVRIGQSKADGRTQIWIQSREQSCKISFVRRIDGNAFCYQYLQPEDGIFCRDSDGIPFFIAFSKKQK